MTNEDALLHLMRSGIGYQVDLFAMLYLRPLENGEFAVGDDDSCEPKEKHWEKCFKDPLDAIRLFEQVRAERGLGYDYEWGREDRWKKLLEENYIPRLALFIREASKDSVLKELYPYYSHTALCFSKVSIYPFTKGLPAVVSHPNGERFYVVNEGPEFLGEGNIDETVKLVREIVSSKQ